LGFVQVATDKDQLVLAGFIGLPGAIGATVAIAFAMTALAIRWITG